MKFFPPVEIKKDVFSSLLYSISKNGKISYLFGSVHFASPDTLLISEETYQAITGANIILLEQFYNKNNAPELELEASKLLNNVMTWLIHNDKLREENAEKIQLIKQKIPDWNDTAIPLALYHQYYDDAVGKTKSYTQLKPIDSLTFETCLVAKAEELNIPCAGLESYSQAQKAYWGLDLNLNEQLEIVTHFLPQLDVGKIETYLPTMIEAFLEGNLEKLTTISLAKFENSEKISSLNKYSDLFITQRDNHMALSMEKYIEKGKAFIAVGASHLPGIIGQLKQKGYEAEAIVEGARLIELGSEKLITNYHC